MGQTLISVRHPRIEWALGHFAVALAVRVTTHALVALGADGLVAGNAFSGEVLFDLVPALGGDSVFHVRLGPQKLVCLLSHKSTSEVIMS